MHILALYRHATFLYVELCDYVDCYFSVMFEMDVGKISRGQQQPINLVGAYQKFSVNLYLQLKLIPHTNSKFSDVTRHMIVNLQ